MRRLVAVLLLTGCGWSTGTIYTFGPVRDARYVRTYSAESSTNYLFCVIPFGERYAPAMAALRAQAGPNFSKLTNLREDTTFRTYLGIICTQTLTLTADLFDSPPRTDIRIEQITPAPSPAPPQSR